MASILQIRKTLAQQPFIPKIDGIVVRNYTGGDDIANWIRIHSAAFNAQKASYIEWNVAGFEREFLHRDWWSPDRMWFAEAATASGRSQPVGTAVLGEKRINGRAVLTVNWLAVVPQMQRRGIGALLLLTVEGAAWQRDATELHAETLASWKAAVELYRSHGYLAITAK